MKKNENTTTTIEAAEIAMSAEARAVWENAMSVDNISDETAVYVAERFAAGDFPEEALADMLRLVEAIGAQNLPKMPKPLTAEEKAAQEERARKAKEERKAEEVANKAALNRVLQDAEEKTAQELCDILNQTADRNEHAPIKAAIEAKLQDENKAAIKAEVETFARTARKDETLFWANLVMNPYATIYTLTESEEGEYSLSERNRRLTFSQIDKRYQELYNGQTIANEKNYVRMIARITNNLYRNTCSDLSADAGEDRAVIRVAAIIDGETTMREVDFSKASKTAIKAQIQAYVDTIMPEAQRVLICSADVNYIIKGFDNAKDGTVKTANEKKVEILIFDSIKSLYTKEAYKVESKAACHKQPEPKKSERTEKQEEIMSKVGERAEAANTLSKRDEQTTED